MATTAPAHPSPSTAVPGEDLVLTPAQRRHFETFGYLHLPGLIRDLVPRITDAFEATWRAAGGGHDGRMHDRRQRSCLVPFIDRHPHLSLLLDEPRIHGVATSLLGEDFVYLGSDGNFYVGDTIWHFDNVAPVHRYVKFLFYLDPLTASTGALRVIPGSHHQDGPFRRRLLDATAPTGLDTQEAYGVLPDGLPAVALDTRPGDVVVFHQNIFHASCHGGDRRRMFTINAAEAFPPERIGELQGALAGQARFLSEQWILEPMRQVATARMRRHLDPVIAQEHVLVEAVRAERQRRVEAARG